MATTDEILAGAKKTLEHANEFAGSLPHHEESAPKHEYSNASYGLAQEARDAAEGIKSRAEMTKKALQ